MEPEQIHQVQYFHIVFPENGTYRVKVADMRAMLQETFPALAELDPEFLAFELTHLLHWNAIAPIAERIALPNHVSIEQEWESRAATVSVLEKPEYLYKYEDVD